MVEPMNAAERKVIDDTIGEMEGLGPYRKAKERRDAGRRSPSDERERHPPSFT